MNNKSDLNDLILSHTDARAPVSKELTVLKANDQAEIQYGKESPVVGRPCFGVLYQADSACSYCPLNQPGSDTRLPPIIGLNESSATLIEERITQHSENVFLITFRNELSIRNISRNSRWLEKDETGQAGHGIYMTDGPA